MASQPPTKVPQLDLAPQLTRPLSPWNPLDYLRLLYWVFYFPQALRWYVETFGGGYIPPSKMNWQQGLDILRDNPIQRQLLLQGAFLLVIPLLLLTGWLKQVQVPIDLGALVFILAGVVAGVVALSAAFGVAGVVAFVVAFAVTGVVAGIVALIVAFILADSVAEGMGFVVVFVMALGWAGVVAVGIVLGVTLGVAFVVAGGVTVGVVGILAGILTGILVLGAVVGVVAGMTLGVAVVVVVVGMVGVAILRLDAWVLGVIGLLLGQNRYLSYAALTPLTLPQTQKQLRHWLRQDWAAGIQNINQLLAYTYQFLPAIETLNRELSLLSSEHLIYRTAQLAEHPYDWNLVRFTSASLPNALQAKFLDRFFILPLRRRWVSLINCNLRLDTPAHATAAGFWLLHDNSPAAASHAFDTVRDCLYGQEMHALAVSLALFETAENVSAIAAIEPPNFPEPPYLRPVTWRALQCFCHVILETKTIVGSVSRTEQALASNQALDKLKHILDNVDEVPEAERQLVRAIAKQWQQALLDADISVGE
ncbi:MAG: hypothetical protein F6J95_003810 [Leptolyngbya sp. SIO1E4]|nr:hypothetical protein [Leptolyngbya sp. SIO1E4]